MEKQARVAVGSRLLFATGSPAIVGAVQESATSNVKTTEIGVQRMAKLQFTAVGERR